jgi:23S rRNA (adenine2503-C2)-methyltransferase
MSIGSSRERSMLRLKMQGLAIQPPHPFALTSHDFARRAAGSIRFGRLGGATGALEAYRHLFRTGDAAGILSACPDFEVPSIRSVMREPSPEGEVLKFTQRVPGATVGTGDAARVFDDLSTESVLIPMIGKRQIRTYTLCLSSQVGCAMGCTFCETAQMGLIRSLSPEEIVAQWFAAAHAVGIRPSNIVFMGMGEPMDNIENVIAAIAVLKDHNGPSLPISKITVSTVGRVDGIRRLGEQLHQPGWHRLNLAVSLNASNDEVRSTIMPINRRWNMAALQEALLSFPIYGGGKLCIEYVLIPGVNDRHEHAKEIADFLAPLNEHYLGRTGRGSVRCMVNLIPYNPRRNSPWEAPAWESVDQFMFWLTDLGVYTKRRRTKGRDLMGACGQLGSEEIRGRKLVPISVEGR